MSQRSKQAERNAQKRAAKKSGAGEEEPTPVSGKSSEGSFSILFEKSKTLVLDSCIVKLAPKLKDLDLLKKEEKEEKEERKAAKEEPEEKNEDEKENTESNGQDEAKEKPAAPADPESAEDLFAAFSARLQWYNTLGLAEPRTQEDALAAWNEMKGLELDWGPRKARKGNPGMDRVLKNICTYLPQYFHLLLALMCLRAFLFRSWFACLPWLVGYQAASLLVPLDLAQLKDVPLKFRVAATMAFHGLVLLFFLYEFVWKLIPVIEHAFWLGILVFHAYVVKPVDAK